MQREMLCRPFFDWISTKARSGARSCSPSVRDYSADDTNNRRKQRTNRLKHMVVEQGPVSPVISEKSEKCYSSARNITQRSGRAESTSQMTDAPAAAATSAMGTCKTRGARTAL
jgi:hypothetical protein